MADRGIILKPWEVRGLLDKRKSMLCRVVKPQPREWWKMYWPPSEGNYITAIHPTGGRYTLRCPFGSPGDTLWCKETFYYPSMSDTYGGIRYRADNRNYGVLQWRPATHMRKRYSRLSLTTKAVRVLRVWDLVYENCLPLGIYLTEDGPLFAHWSDGQFTHNCETPIEVVKYIHNQDNPKHPWDTNPWCWLGTTEVKK